MKSKRQAKIVEIISTTNVETQEQLLQLLQEAGFTSTQATISRDIKELRLIKTTSAVGGYKYALPETTADTGYLPKLKTIFRECVVKVDYAQNIVVVRSLTGMANAAAAAIDAMKIDEIVGTLAGDDTIFILMKTTEEAHEMVDAIRDMLK
jgi:transcriptional regulator of arginine metabolism